MSLYNPEQVKEYMVFYHKVLAVSGFEAFSKKDLITIQEIVEDGRKIPEELTTDTFRKILGHLEKVVENIK